MFAFIKNFIKFIMSRFFIISILILIQIALIFFLFYQIAGVGLPVYFTFQIIGVFTSLIILNRHFNPAYKISWIFIILVFPIIGVGFYIIFGRVRLSKSKEERIKQTMNHNNYIIDNDFHVLKAIEDPSLQKIVNFIEFATDCKVYKNTKTKLLTPGKVFFSELILALKQAKHYIFMEYFIIQDGLMWQTIVDILIEKAKDGLDVRLIFDDFGCIHKTSRNFKKILTSQGLKVVNFNPFRPKLSSFMNYRDHRKTTVVDGKIGFLGGINLSDEYINQIERFGHWKDTSVRLEGGAVRTLAILFIQLWEFSTKEHMNINEYLPDEEYTDAGIVQVFGDSPFSSFQVTENVYISLLNHAKKTAYIMTPYLILDNELLSAILMCARSGVDVRIFTPHIPDKKIVFYVTQSYYTDLLEAGVKIYEYLPGFLHSKCMAVDDEVGVVSSANLDYRSLYLHLEVSAFMIHTQAVDELVEDFSHLIDVSMPISLKDMKNQSFFKKVIVFFLKVFSPLL
ncbi:MAG: cardiolipin synthase [Bacilli bacterium]